MVKLHQRWQVQSVKVKLINFLIPVSKCSAQIVGVAQKSISEYIDDLVNMIEKLNK